MLNHRFQIEGVSGIIYIFLFQLIIKSPQEENTDLKCLYHTENIHYIYMYGYHLCINGSTTEKLIQ